ncbi:MAG: YihY/virulence factor BrkB family protein [Clostridia bacterium]|nr:YihY/virulence factor BrkB family protein [Clostridia bacterium]
MSIVPLSFWLTLIVGKLPIDAERILSLPVFESVKNVLLYVRKEAINATASASVLLLVTTLYSSTTLFYQMRHSGELIYGYRKERQGLRLRFGAFLLLLIVMLTVVVFAVLFAFGSVLFSKYLPQGLETVADYMLLIALSFALVLLLNAYICPYKMKLGAFLPGAAITVLAWCVVVTGFAVYLKVSNMTKLYGALSVVIVFLLWLYVLMICFIVGVIINSEKIESQRKLHK